MPQPIAAVAIVALQLTTTGIVVGFAERDSLLRLGGMAIMLLAAHSQLAEERVQHPIARTFLGAASVFLVVMYVDATLLSRWTFDAKGPTSFLGGLDPNLGRSGQGKEQDSTKGSETTESRSRNVAARLRFGFYVALQSRFPCTPWGVKHTQGFLSSEIPSRASFIAPILLKITICTLILRMGSSLGDPSQNAVLFSPTKVPLVGNIIDPTAGWSSCIDWEQLHIRLLAVLGYWTVQYLVINLLYDCLAVFAVALHITEVDVWPPVFGRGDEAWSLRQFWG
jgi:hypothetical protein